MNTQITVMPSAAAVQSLESKMLAMTEKYSKGVRCSSSIEPFKKSPAYLSDYDKFFYLGHPVEAEVTEFATELLKSSNLSMFFRLIAEDQPKRSRAPSMPQQVQMSYFHEGYALSATKVEVEDKTKLVETMEDRVNDVEEIKDPVFVRDTQVVTCKNNSGRLMITKNDEVPHPTFNFKAMLVSDVVASILVYDNKAVKLGTDRTTLNKVALHVHVAGFLSLISAFGATWASVYSGNEKHIPQKGNGAVFSDILYQVLSSPDNALTLSRLATHVSKTFKFTQIHTVKTKDDEDILWPSANPSMSVPAGYTQYFTVRGGKIGILEYMTPMVLHNFVKLCRAYRGEDERYLSSLTLGYFYGLYGTRKTMVAMYNWYNIAFHTEWTGITDVIVNPSSASALEGLLFAFYILHLNVKVHITGAHVGKFMYEYACHPFQNALDIVILTRQGARVYDPKSTVYVDMVTSSPLKSSSVMSDGVERDCNAYVEGLLSLDCNYIRLAFVVDPLIQMHNVKFIINPAMHNMSIIIYRGVATTSKTGWWALRTFATYRDYQRTVILSNLFRNTALVTNNYKDYARGNALDVPTFSSVFPYRKRVALTAGMVDEEMQALGVNLDVFSDQPVSEKLARGLTEIQKKKNSEVKPKFEYKPKHPPEKPVEKIVQEKQVEEDVYADFSALGAALFDEENEDGKT